MRNVKKGELIEEFRKNTFEVLRVERFAKDYIYARNSYITNLSAFIFPIKGRAKIEFDNKVFIAEPGKVIHGCKNKHLSFKVLGDEEFEHINIYYIADEYIDDDSYMNSIFELSVSNYDEILKSLEELIEMSSRHKLISKVNLQIQTALFLREIFTDYNYKRNLSEKEFTLEISKFISENYMKEITLSTLSERYGEKSNRISYLFNKYLNIRPIDYLIQCRMAVSYRLLNEGFSVKEVSKKVGYNDEFYFSRIFKKSFGVTPSRLKKG
ncbi:AraC family transcriptional regulator [Clostridium sp.]|uniref:helix-turn-helix domain-containing protein n=1 Tax=Clostridium sp. TaxID=1506 RepID=UPI0026249A0A|nr:AraC family transcriptional regulator [Clostridium sp.]